MNQPQHNSSELHSLSRARAPASAVLDERAAAAYIGVSTSSLRKGRMTGAREGYMQPPPYVKLGRSVRYLQSDLDQYLARFRHSGCEA